jgi:hypothetical protein
MDLRTEQVLKLIQSQHKIRSYAMALCYAMIAGGVLIYIFYAFSQSRSIKLIHDKAQNMKEYQTEKIMTNPRIKLQHEDGNIYDIHAKKAFHRNQDDMTLFDVFAQGEIGKITAGELEISEEGDHLVFTKNPVLILNQTK